MKTLLLLRHAKSSRDDPTLNDFDRALNDRGKDDAKLIGRFIRREQLAIDLIVSSPAKRARRTTESVLKTAELPHQPMFDERIYEAGIDQLLTVVSQIESSHNVALMVGHNPGFEDLLISLTDHAARLPTAALACIDLDIREWRDVAPRC